MKIALLFLSFLFVVQLNAQEENTVETESIGFAYGVAGMGSEVFAEVEKLLKNKDFEQLIRLLSSDSPSYIFVSTIVCQELIKKKEITLRHNELETLNANLVCQMSLSVQSGCTCSKIVTVEELFKGVQDCGFNSSLKQWLSTLF